MFRELGIGIVAYSPLGRGFLSGGSNMVENLSEQDSRKVRISYWNWIIFLISYIFLCVKNAAYSVECFEYWQACIKTCLLSSDWCRQVRQPRSTLRGWHRSASLTEGQFLICVWHIKYKSCMNKLLICKAKLFYLNLINFQVTLPYPMANFKLSSQNVHNIFATIHYISIMMW